MIYAVINLKLTTYQAFLEMNPERRLWRSWLESALERHLERSESSRARLEEKLTYKADIPAIPHMLWFEGGHGLHIPEWPTNICVSALNLYITLCKAAPLTQGQYLDRDCARSIWSQGWDSHSAASVMAACRLFQAGVINSIYPFVCLIVPELLLWIWAWRIVLLNYS